MSGLENVQKVRVSDIEDAPCNVTVVVDASVSHVAALIRDGSRYPVPVLASRGGRLYAIGNIETVAAARECGADSLDCVVEEADSEEKVVMLHMLNSRTKTYHPTRLMRVVRDVVEGGGDTGYIPSEYVFLAEVDLDSRAERKLDGFVGLLAKKKTEVPSMVQIIHPLSKLSKGRQYDAVNDLVKYSTMEGKIGYAGDRVARSIFAKYRKGGAGDTVKIPEKGRKGAAGEPDGGGGDEVRVTVDGGSRDIGTEVRSVTDSVKYRCECGNDYLISLKNGTIKKMTDTGSNVAATDVDGRVIYGLSDGDADFLGLDLSPVINTYHVGRGDTGDAIVLSKKRISKKKMVLISQIIDS